MIPCNPTHNKSLGTLRINRKTKDKSPDLVGQIKILEDLVLALYHALKQKGDTYSPRWQHGSTEIRMVHALRSNCPNLTKRSSKSRLRTNHRRFSTTLPTGRRTMITKSTRTRTDQLTAFRLPSALMRRVDLLCAKEDITRSQLFRRCILTYLGPAENEAQGNTGNRLCLHK